MPRLRGQRVLDPGALSAAELERAVDEVYAVHDAIFAGVDRASFRKYVFESPADRTRILLNLGEHDAVVGYAAIHFYVRELAGRQVTVVRNEVGLLRAYRGSSGAGAFLVGELLRWKLRHPLQRMLSQSSPVHPATFAVFGRYARQMWPHWEHPVPAEIEAFLFALADDFGLERADPARPYVRKVGWITRQTEQEAEYWASSKRPAAAFFVAENPTYTQGTGLLTLVSLDLATVFGAIRQLLAKRLRSLRARWLPARALNKSLAREQLRSLTALAGAAESEVERLLLRLGRVALPAGEVLFHGGEPSQDVYLLASGAVFVLAPTPDGGDDVIDQLGAGAVLGEIGVLTRRPRSATVRAATACEFFRIGGGELRALIEESSEDDSLWRVVLARMLESFLRDGDSSRAERLVLAEQAVFTVLAAGEAVAAPGTWMLLAGELEVTSAAGRGVVSAPALLPGTEQMQLTARSSVRLASLSS